MEFLEVPVFHVFFFLSSCCLVLALSDLFGDPQAEWTDAFLRLYMVVSVISEASMMSGACWLLRETVMYIMLCPYGLGVDWQKCFKLYLSSL